MSPLSHLSDNQLISLLIQDDRIAFRELYDRYIHDLYYFILRTSKSPALAEDVVHDVYIKIWENRQSIDGSKEFKPYLFTVAKNHLLNLLKRVRNESFIMEELKKHTVNTEHSTEMQLNFNESNSIIFEAISKLPEQSRKIFNLCKIDGKSYKKVAEELGITEGTVNTQMVRALKSIKQYIISKGSLSLILLHLIK